MISKSVWFQIILIKPITSTKIVSTVYRKLSYLVKHRTKLYNNNGNKHMSIIKELTYKFSELTAEFTDIV